MLGCVTIKKPAGNKNVGVIDWMDMIRKGLFSKLNAPHLKQLSATERVFIAILDRLFEETESKSQDILKKKKLCVLDVGCGNMPYARSLKLFFENFGCVREVSLLGIDKKESLVNIARERIRSEQIDNVTVVRSSLQNIRKTGFDIITVFNVSPTKRFNEVELAKKDAAVLFKILYEHLSEDGLLILSFYSDDEFERYVPILSECGFNVICKEKNKFKHLLKDMRGHTNLCLARKIE